MLYGEICDEQYEPNELEILEKSDHSLDRQCIRECKSCLEQNLCPERKGPEDKDFCCGCQFKFTDPSKCENC